ncbi:hypothetical protein BDF22DRAFT_658333 [Syncephalis plumigaleata]|nr:hypothetical protein BDF22DRAFT_658333 [Syncephalis plumigaleata]
MSLRHSQCTESYKATSDGDGRLTHKLLLKSHTAPAPCSYSYGDILNNYAFRMEQGAGPAANNKSDVSTPSKAAIRDTLTNAAALPTLGDELQQGAVSISASNGSNSTKSSASVSAPILVPASKSAPIIIPATTAGINDGRAPIAAFNSAPIPSPAISPAISPILVPAPATSPATTTAISPIIAPTTTATGTASEPVPVQSAEALPNPAQLSAAGGGSTGVGKKHSKFIHVPFEWLELKQEKRAKLVGWITLEEDKKQELLLYRGGNLSFGNEDDCDYKLPLDKICVFNISEENGMIHITNGGSVALTINDQQEAENSTFGNVEQPESEQVSPIYYIQMLGGYYHTTERLGGGAFGTVYKGVSCTTGEEVAIKQAGSDDTTLVNEWGIMQKFRQQQHILRAISFNIDDYGTFVVTELAKGGSLKDYVNKNPPYLPETKVKIIVRQILLALQDLHEANMAHLGK